MSRKCVQISKPLYFSWSPSRGVQSVAIAWLCSCGDMTIIFCEYLRLQFCWHQLKLSIECSHCNLLILQLVSGMNHSSCLSSSSAAVSEEVIVDSLCVAWALSALNVWSLLFCLIRERYRGTNISMTTPSPRYGMTWVYSQIQLGEGASTAIAQLEQEKVRVCTCCSQSHHDGSSIALSNGQNNRDHTFSAD